MVSAQRLPGTYLVWQRGRAEVQFLAASNRLLRFRRCRNDDPLTVKPNCSFKKATMRKLTLLSIVLLISGCGGDQVDNASLLVDESTPPAAANSDPTNAVAPTAETSPAITAKLPFDMPIMPGARYLSGMDFSKPTKRRGPEAIATIIANGTTLEVVEFYEKAMTENGFAPTVGKNNDLSTAKVWGERENGEMFSVTCMRGGSKTKEGECQTAIIATKPKPEEEE